MPKDFPLRPSNARACWPVMLLLALGVACIHTRYARSDADLTVLEREYALVRDLPKPAPETSSFSGCRPWGARPDRALNLRKNRADTAAVYTPLSLEALGSLPAPRSTAYRFRGLWTTSESKQLAAYEGAAVTVEAYLVKVTVEMPEPANCYARDSVRRDWHLHLGATRDAGIMQSTIVEVTPRFRARHPEWTRARLDSLVRAGARVRISGWTLYDQMHVISRRHTPWEIHPVTRIEAHDGSGWRIVSADAATAGPAVSSSVSRGALP
ncbi:MAG TPA: hypothetical protein VFJ20_08205 [Gemmatimonadaceae bacterium]|nr:hypothetical protein [Gemmatimonadaceae bacterium]